MSKHMNHEEVRKFNTSFAIIVILCLIMMIGAQLKNEALILIPFLLIIPVGVYGVKHARKAVEIDVVYYGQICTDCKSAIADCPCMAEIDGAWDDAK